jgi:hypothetical protein
VEVPDAAAPLRAVATAEARPGLPHPAIDTASTHEGEPSLTRMVSPPVSKRPVTDRSSPSPTRPARDAWPVAGQPNWTAERQWVLSAEQGNCRDDTKIPVGADILTIDEDRTLLRPPVAVHALTGIVLRHVTTYGVRRQGFRHGIHGPERCLPQVGSPAPAARLRRP